LDVDEIILSLGFFEWPTLLELLQLRQLGWSPVPTRKHFANVGLGSWKCRTITSNHITIILMVIIVPMNASRHGQEE